MRIATHADLSDLVKLGRTAFLQAFTPQNKLANVRFYLDVAFTEKQFLMEIQNPSSVFFLLEANGKLAGYTKVNQVPAQTDIHDPESLEIARLYVLEEFLGAGLGKVLLDIASGYAKDCGKSYLWLGVWEKNARAIRFYEKHGLRKFGEHPFPFGDEVQTDWLMRKDF